LDIGANTGIYATLAKVYHPAARVVAFEPQPNIFAVLKKNNEINRFDIVCENLAFSDQEGLLPFYNYGPEAFTTANTTVGSLNKDWAPGEDWQPELHRNITVPVKKLAHYVEEQKIDKIDLMKIDVETLEYEVLVGYGKYLFYHQPLLILEVQDQTIGEKIESLFRDIPYTFYTIEEEAGLRAVAHLGRSADNKNYLLCPSGKSNLLSPFLSGQAKSAETAGGIS
jgi:FkbM family methyltransferase